MGRGRAPQRGRLSGGRQDVKNLIRQFRAEEGWLGHTEAGLPAWPSHATDPTLKRVPVGVRAATENLDDLGVTTGKLAGQAVTTLKLADFSVENAKLASGSVGSVKIIDQAVTTVKIAAGAVTITKIDDNLKNPGQAAHGLRTIGGDGGSLAAAAADHSHGSGNSMDFDYLPAALQERVFLARTRVRQNVGQLGTMTIEQMRLYIRELAIVASMALTLQIDAPDLRADERKAMRDRGEPYGEFFEHRRRDVLDARGKLHDRGMRHYQSPPPEIAEIVV